MGNDFEKKLGITLKKVIESIEKGNLVGLTIAKDIAGNKWKMLTPETKKYMIGIINKIKKENKLNEAILA